MRQGGQDDLVFDLTQANSLQKAGGKAHALHRMLEAGFNVPGGFVVSADAYMAMTPSLERSVLSAFDDLHASYVAIRSSAINEDGTEAAWAGQLDTFLNCTRDNLVRHVEQCWDSANSARAKSYAEQKHLEGTKVAVIVQEMVQPSVSGVAFSAHPVTSNRNLVVIEAGFGLGEAIVSGQITPDTYIMDKQTGETTEKQISRQRRMLIKNERGETEWKDLDERGEEQKLTDQQITELATDCSKLEEYFGYPVDVEWAISRDTLHILQCRPITSLR